MPDLVIRFCAAGIGKMCLSPVPAERMLLETDGPYQDRSRTRR